MKKLFAVLLAVLMCVTLFGCGEKDTKKTIYIMGPTPDHGWTAQAGTYAQQKAEEITAEGKYNAVYLAASSGEAQVDQINSTIIPSNDACLVVMMPLEDSAAAGQEALHAAGIPFISFDRIIESTEKYAILNASGDNWQCGAGIAYWLQKNGMEPGDTVVVLYGDNGTVCGRRQEGFELFLKNESSKDFAGEYINNENGTVNTYKTEKVWTDEELAKVFNTYSTVCDWSADKAQNYMEQKLADIVADAKANGGKLYIYSMDDEMTFGVLNVLENIDKTNPTLAADVEGLELYISAIGGMQELYDVITGKSAKSAVAEKYFDDMMSVYFSPKMMKDIIARGLDYLAGDWDVELGGGEYQPVFIVDAANAATTEGFTGH